jgi:8-oxo-dGTP pyrophosphatase MutT (NUDIX family)
MSGRQGGAGGGPGALRRGVVGIAVEAAEASAGVGGGSRMLVVRRSRHVEAPGAICFPGGHIEAGETEEDALRREFREELQLAVRPRRRLWESVAPWGVVLAWWQVEIEPGARPQPNPAEVEHFAWHGIEELLEMPDLLESNREFLKRLHSGEVDLMTL